ncbi:MAG: glycoside hydrolase family 3 C-terminal domain-containing protein [Bacteroidales bacterium]
MGQFLRVCLVGLMILCGCNQRTNHTWQDPGLPVEERVEDLLDHLTLEEKLGFLTGKDMWHFKGVERLGIPAIQVTDCGHGITVVLDEQGHNTGCATCFPTAVGQASTWNRELIRKTGAALGREARYLGSSIILAPMVNIHRTPLGGRNYETYSEDPYLAGKLASSLIKGIQSEHIGAVIKAVTANNQQTYQGSHSVEVSERALREIYLPAFRMAVSDARPRGIMTSYNKVNGVYTSASKHLISDIIKNEWQYKGFVVSDWRGTHGIEALSAGLDIEMPGPGKILTREAVLNEMEHGRFTEEELDDRVRRILRAIVKSMATVKENDQIRAEWNTGHHHELARQVAEEGIILLKNEGGLLPLEISRIHTLAVIGPNAKEARLGGGGSASVTACYAVSPLQGIKNHCGEDIRIFFREGCTMKGEMPMINTQYLIPPEGEENGLKGAYFTGKELSGDPTLVRIDGEIDFSWGWAAPCREVPRGDYSVRWTGRIDPPVTGEYRIGVSCTEGGIRFYLDNELVIDRWGDPYHENFEASFRRFSESIPVHMEAGVPRDIQVEFHKKANRNSIRLEWRIPGRADPLKQAVEVAAESDAAIVFAGLSNLYEGGTADRESLFLPDQQNELIRAVCNANPRTVVVLINGTPVAMPWLERVPALLEAYYPGQEGGNAIANILFGKVNPSGKLPESFPLKLEDNPSYGNFPGDREKVNYEEGIYVGYRHYDKEKIDPLFPFGYGLSYTWFGYSGLRVEYTGDGCCRVSAAIENRGPVPGKEIVQLYIRDLQSTIDRPEKELKGFVKISLEPGEKKRVSIRLEREHFACFDPQLNRWVVEPGVFEIMVGSSSKDIRLIDTLCVASNQNK